MIEVSQAFLVLIVLLLGVYFIFIYIEGTKVERLRKDTDYLLRQVTQLYISRDLAKAEESRPVKVRLVKIPKDVGSEYYEVIRGVVSNMRDESWSGVRVGPLSDHPWDIEVVRAEDDHPNGIDITLL